jgi:hypothetical protein
MEALLLSGEVMQIKQIALLWFITISLYTCSGPAALQSIEDVSMLKPEEFAIFPWGETPGDPNVLKEIRECGFNLAGFVEPEHLDLVSEAGLKCIVSDKSTHVSDAVAQLDENEISRRVEALLERVGQHRAVFGYFLCDEPGTRLYPALKKWVEAYRKVDPKALSYINLSPNYTSPAKLNVPTYAEYLGSYVDTVQSKLISYDHYALMEDGSLRDGYFQNLEAVRLESLRSGLPFWNVVLANAHSRYADPTEAGLRFQLYTTLAYGARGIGYFTYFTPNDQFRLAPIDKFGHKTRTWDMLRSVNLQAHRLGQVYVKLRSVNVFHHPDVPQGCSGLETSRFIAKVGGGSLLVGEFEGPGGQPFVIVVNKSLQHAIDLNIKFKDAGQIQQVNANKGQIEPWDYESNRLAAGQGLLLFLKQ